MNEVKVKLSRPQLSVKTSRASLVLDMAGQGSGKTLNISIDVIEKVRSVPRAIGFIGANTHKQLSQSTLKNCFKYWKDIAGWTKWSKSNPDGVYTVNTKPPEHFRQYEILDDYRGTICFQNGTLIFTGSLKNYLAHDGKEFGWAHLDETKDTKKEALTTVILARLRQYGIWVAPKQKGKPYFFDDKITPEEAIEQGLEAFNPCYVHTSPSLGDIEWILDLFELKPFEKEIAETLSDPFKFYHRDYNGRSVTIYQTYWNERNLKPNYIEEQKSRMTGEEQSLFIDGNPFAKTGSEFFNEFQKRNTVVERVPFNFEGTFNASFDFNASPYTTLLVGQTDYIVKFHNEKTGEKKDFLEVGDEGFAPIEVMRIFIQKEFLDRDGDTDGACRSFIDWLEVNEASGDINIWGDATGRSRIAGLGATTNFKLIEEAFANYATEMKAKKSNISVKLRRKFMNKLFAGKIPNIELYIAEECEELIRDLMFLKKAPDGTKHKEKETDPHTGKSFEKIGHCFVGETLIETSEGKKRIDEIKVGDYVFTRKGLKKVLNVFDNGIKNVRKYTMNGKIIECTDNHLIFTKNRGFVKAFELIESDNFYTFEENKTKCQNLQQKKTFFKSLTDSIFDYIRPKNISKAGVSSTERKPKQPHIVTFGKSIMEKLKKVFRFTTKTKTNQIIQSETLKNLRRNNIQENILPKNEKNKAEKFLMKKPDQKQKNGTVQKKGENGTPNTQRQVSLGRLENLIVPIVQRTSKPPLKSKNIVPINAKSNLIIEEKSRMEKVFDLEIEDEHEYFANEILVHNCSDALEYFICELCRDWLKE